MVMVFAPSAVPLMVGLEEVVVSVVASIVPVTGVDAKAENGTDAMTITAASAKLRRIFIVECKRVME
jgi:hypothetical protein